MCIALHLLALNCICHLTAYSCSLKRSAWSPSQSFLDISTLSNFIFEMKLGNLAKLKGQVPTPILVGLHFLHPSIGITAHLFLLSASCYSASSWSRNIAYVVGFVSLFTECFLPAMYHQVLNGDNGRAPIALVSHWSTWRAGTILELVLSLYACFPLISMRMTLIKILLSDPRYCLYCPMSRFQPPVVMMRSCLRFCVVSNIPPFPLPTHLSIICSVSVFHCRRFFYLSDSVVVLSSLGLYTEKDIAFLKSKVSTINKLFLNSDIPPKLRVRGWSQVF